MPAGPDSPIRPCGNARPRNLAPSRLTARRDRPATNQNDRLGWTENDNGWTNRATERDHRGSEPTDQSGTVGPRRDPLGLRRPGRHTSQCPDHLYLERLAYRHVHSEERSVKSARKCRVGCRDRRAAPSPE